MSLLTASSRRPDGRAASAAGIGHHLAWCFVAATGTAGLAVAALVVTGRDDDLSSIQVAGSMLVVLWTIAGLTLGIRRRDDRSIRIVLTGTSLAGAGCLARAITRTASQPGVAAVLWRVCATTIPAVVLHLLVALPDGRLDTSVRRRLVVIGYVIAAAVGIALCSDLDRFRYWPLVALWFIAAAVGGNLALLRYRTSGAGERRRMQWLLWGLTVTTAAAIVTLTLRLLTGTPESVGTVTLVASAAVPLAVIAGTARRFVAGIDRLIACTVEVAGLIALVIGLYTVVVLGLGRSPDGADRTLLLLSMAATGLAALLYVPARTWLTERVNRLMYGARLAPDETLRAFGERLTRSIPLDELLLQLAENLRASMGLISAEVWIGQGGHYERIAGVPHRRPEPVEIGDQALPFIARAGVRAGTWIDIWMPQIVGPTGSAAMHLAPIAYGGSLLGFIVVTRALDDDPFDENDGTVLTEISRQVGLALHNVQLDAALEASLGELRLRNHELQSSRARIVSTGDAERRKLERNLHDGAQQHLVALAVKLRLAQDAVVDDPQDAATMIEEIKGDVQLAIAELRALAHGIFPPLLASGGLVDALPAAAARATPPTTVELDGVGRYPDDVEATVYFCVLEALQNAAKHAGDDATVRVLVDERDSLLRFEIHDDGVGFDPTVTGENTRDVGHGFVNMADRLGAIGGSLAVESTPGSGTTITGSIPIDAGAAPPTSPFDPARRVGLPEPPQHQR